MDTIIRPYTSTDHDGVIACVIYLQNYERLLEPEEKTKGEDIAHTFLMGLLAEHEKKRGRLLVAERDGRIVGFTSGWVEHQPDEEHLIHKSWFYVSDLVVLPEFAGQGIGKELLGAMEQYAIELGHTRLQINVLARNENARAFYQKMGYRELELTVQKILPAPLS